jgi:ribosomal-protein-alanine acetyltransferase
MLRLATTCDLDQLAALEQRAFGGDRLSRRSFRRMLTRATAALLVDEQASRVRGYALVLFHGGRRQARLYSIAVDPEARGRGVGQALLEAAEAEARARGCVAVRLELRPDSAAALAMYKSRGYRVFGVRSDYYEDHADAIRMEKVLAGEDAAPPPGHAAHARE